MLRLLGIVVALLGAGAPLAAFADETPTVATQPATQQVLVLLRMTPEHFRPNTDYGGSYGDGLAQRARQRLADRLANDYGLVRVDNWAMPALGVDCFILDVPAGQSPAVVAEKLSRDARVAWSQPMNQFLGQAGPARHNDPLYQVQPAATEWRLAELHQIATGRNVRVAVIDSRVDRAHPDLAGQIEVSEDFVPEHAGGPEQHGTGVAGVIAALADNDIGMVGVAPRSRLMALRACWQQPAGSTVCNTLGLAKALDFAIARNAQIINMSLSGPQDILLGRLIDMAVARGIVVVGSYDPAQAKGGFPASHPGVVAVADESQADRPAGVYTAPGHDIPTTQPGARWYLVNGSSYAAAHVSGLLALLRERGPLRQGPLSLVSLRAEGGLIDACATLTRSPLPCACSCTRAAQ